MKFQYRLGLVLSIASVALLFFQNCGEGFKALEGLSETSTAGGESEWLESRFSSESSSIVTLKNSFPLSFEGNGHNTTWDGRLIIFTSNRGWEATIFRPERVVAEQGKSINLGSLNRSGAFSSPLAALKVSREDDGGIASDFARDSVGNRSALMQLNALTFAPASGVPGSSNPFKSDANGVFSASGQFETYDLYIYTQHYGDPNWGIQNRQIKRITDQHGLKVFGRLHMKVVVERPKTPNARPLKSILISDFEPIRTVTNQTIHGIEPSVTSDGKFMIFNSNHVNGNGDEILYLHNSNPSSLSGWSSPKRITYLVDESDNFKAQYAIARAPILAANGSVYSRGESLLGAYPWLSWEGSEITFMAAHAHHPTAGARRGGFSIVGRWTGNKVRHIDGSFNRDTTGTTGIRLFTSAIGSTSSIWNPMLEMKNPALPYLFEQPSFFMISSNTAEFSEVGFRDYVDGRYEISLPMNPLLNKVTSANAINNEFNFNQTADLSRNHLNGELTSGARFPLENIGNIQDTPRQIGARGQAVEFSVSGSIVVRHHPSLNQTQQGLTYEIFVKPTADLSNLAGPATLSLISKPGNFNLVLEKDRRVQAQINVGGTTHSSGLVGSLPLGQWSHVAVTHDPSSGRLIVYVNSLKVSDTKVNSGTVNASTQNLILGPGGQNPVSFQGVVLHLDEFKYSSVVRSSVEIADSAGIPYRDRYSPSLISMLPSQFKAENTRYPASEPIAVNRAQLGYLLFNDARLSSNNQVSCATCHSETQSFAESVSFSTGVSGVKLSRHTPVIFNRLFGSTQMWDGSKNSLEQQTVGPLAHPDEMGMGNFEAVVTKLRTNPSYVRAFRSVYNSEIDRASIENALATFQASLVTTKSKFDSYFTDNDIRALSAQEIRGKDIFFGKAKCAACHSGPNFTDEQFHNIGFFPNSRDFGKGSITNRTFDQRAFKTPTLRNVAQSAPYMHDGSLQTLEQVIALYNAGSFADGLRDSEIKPLNLSANESADLVAFLKTLSSPILPIVSFNLNLKKVEDVYPVNGPINGGWSNWVNVGSCSKPCGGGVQEQNRSCTNPAPANGGSQCQGLTTQQVACNTQTCPPTSGTFIVENGRSLKPGESWGNGTLNLSFQNDGNFVLYQNNKPIWNSKTQRNCNAGSSCQAILQGDGNLVLYRNDIAYWHTQTFGQGALRLRVTGEPPYIALINGSNRVIWSNNGFEIAAPFPINGGWSSWVNVGSCSKPCGGGVQEQNRSCTNPAPANGGSQCQGLTTQQVACNTQTCPPTSGTFIVENGRSLKPGESWGNGTLNLFFQHDGNFVLYQNNKAIWDSKTQRNCNAGSSCQAILQGDGNLVLYRNDIAYWHTQTFGQGALRLRVTGEPPYIALINESNKVILIRAVSINP